jgi:hypothetical protein
MSALRLDDIEYAPLENEQGADRGIAPAVGDLIWYGEQPPVPNAYLIADTLPETGVAILGGQFGGGKTFVAVNAVAAVIKGSNFAGKPVARPRGVLWLAAEGEVEIEGRVRAALATSDEKQPFARQAAGVPVLTGSEAPAQLLALATKAAAKIRENFNTELVLIVIDTLSAAAGFGDENSAAEVQKVMNVLHNLSRATKALILLIDHHGKAVETGIRGSSAKSGAADAILACLGDRDLEGNVSNHRMAVAKLRSGPTGRVVPFNLRVVDNGIGGNTCVVDWKLDREIMQPLKATKGSPWPRSLVVFKRALDATLLAAGERLHPFPDGLELLTVDRERIRDEFIFKCQARNLLRCRMPRPNQLSSKTGK